MKQINKCLILFIGLFLLLGACMNLKQPAEKIEYYALEYPSPQIVDLPPLPSVIRVDRFTTTSSYNTSQMIYRDRSFKRKAYIYHKWQTTPGALVTALVNRDMKNSRLFKAILSPDSRFSPSYIIEGTIDEFFEWDTSDAWKAILSVSIILSKKNSEDISESILFQKTYHQAQVCQRKHPKAVAGAMSRALSKISEEMIKDVYDCLKAES